MILEQAERLKSVGMVGKYNGEVSRLEKAEHFRLGHSSRKWEGPTQLPDRQDRPWPNDH